MYRRYQRIMRAVVVIMMVVAVMVVVIMVMVVVCSGMPSTTTFTTITIITIIYLLLLPLYIITTSSCRCYFYYYYCYHYYYEYYYCYVLFAAALRAIPVVTPHSKHMLPTSTTTITISTTTTTITSDSSDSDCGSTVLYWMAHADLASPLTAPFLSFPCPAEPGREKVSLLIESGVRVHCTRYARSKPQLPSAFVMKLRKHLRGRRLTRIVQMGGDRVLDLTFGSGELEAHLIVELYDRGNVVLTDKDYTILSLLRAYTLEVGGGTGAAGAGADAVAGSGGKSEAARGKGKGTSVNVGASKAGSAGAAKADDTPLDATASAAAPSQRVRIAVKQRYTLASEVAGGPAAADAASAAAASAREAQVVSVASAPADAVAAAAAAAPMIIDLNHPDERVADSLGAYLAHVDSQPWTGKQRKKLTIATALCGKGSGLDVYGPLLVEHAMVLAGIPQDAPLSLLTGGAHVPASRVGASGGAVSAGSGAAVPAPLARTLLLQLAAQVKKLPALLEDISTTPGPGYAIVEPLSVTASDGAGRLMDAVGGSRSGEPAAGTAVAAAAAAAPAAGAAHGAAGSSAAQALLPLGCLGTWAEVREKYEARPPAGASSGAAGGSLEAAPGGAVPTALPPAGSPLATADGDTLTEGDVDALPEAQMPPTLPFTMVDFVPYLFAQYTHVVPTLGVCTPVASVGAASPHGGAATAVAKGGGAGKRKGIAGGVRYVVFPNFDSLCDEYFSRLDVARAEKAEASAVHAAQRRVERIREGHTAHLEALAAQQSGAYRHGRLIEQHATDVDRALLVVRSALENSVSWVDLQHLVDAETAAGNPIAKLIAGMDLKRSVITVALRDDEAAEAAAAERRAAAEAAGVDGSSGSESDSSTSSDTDELRAVHSATVRRRALGGGAGSDTDARGTDAVAATDSEHDDHGKPQRGRKPREADAADSGLAHAVAARLPKGDRDRAKAAIKGRGNDGQAGRKGKGVAAEAAHGASEAAAASGGVGGGGGGSSGRAGKAGATQPAAAASRRRYDKYTALVEVTVWDSAAANARRYFQSGKGAREKEGKALAAAAVAVKRAEKAAAEQAAKQIAAASSVRAIRVARKPLWFERFLWCITSEGLVVVAGRNAQDNEQLVKRYLRPQDAYVHAEIHGAATVILRNPSHDPAASDKLPALSLSQAGQFCVCLSSAWASHTPTSAWWVHASQVSKTAPTGEYLPTGSFMIRGKKNMLPPVRLELGYCLLFKVDDACVDKHLHDRFIRGADDSDTEAERDLAAPAEGASAWAADGSGAGRVAAPAVEGPAPPTVGSTHEGTGAAPRAGSSEGADAETGEAIVASSGSADDADDAEGASEDGGTHSGPDGSGDSGDSEDSRNSGDSGDSAAKAGNPQRDATARSERASSEAHGGAGEGVVVVGDGVERFPSDNGRIEEGGDLPETAGAVSDTHASLEASVAPSGSEIAAVPITAHVRRQAKKLEKTTAADATTALRMVQAAVLHQQRARAASSARSTAVDGKAPASSRGRGDGAAAQIPGIEALDEEMPREPESHVAAGRVELSAASNLKRGQRAKARKMKHKYAEQDEMDRALAMAALGHKAAKPPKSMPTSTKPGPPLKGDGSAVEPRSRGDGTPAAKFERSDRRARPAGEAAAPPAGGAGGNPAAGGEVPDDESAPAEPGPQAAEQELRALAALVSAPRPDDILTHAVPMLAPHNVALACKYRVKLVPGPLKKGKAAQAALQAFAGQAKAFGTARERDLIKALADAEVVQTIIGNVKVQAPGGGEGGGVGHASGGGGRAGAGAGGGKGDKARKGGHGRSRD